MKYQLPDKITGRLQIGYISLEAVDGVVEIDKPGAADLEILAIVGATEIKSKPKPTKKAATKAADEAVSK